MCTLQPSTLDLYIKKTNINTLSLQTYVNYERKYYMCKNAWLTMLVDVFEAYTC